MFYPLFPIVVDVIESIESSSSAARFVFVFVKRTKLHTFTSNLGTKTKLKKALNGQTTRLSQTKVLRPAELETASDIEFETSLEESAERSEQSDEASARKESKSCIKTRQQKRRQRQTKRSEPRIQEKSRPVETVKEIQTKRQGFRTKPIITPHGIQKSD